MAFFKIFWLFCAIDSHERNLKHCKEEDFGAQWALPMEIAAWKKFSSEEVSEKKSKAVEIST